MNAQYFMERDRIVQVDSANNCSFGSMISDGMLLGHCSCLCHESWMCAIIHDHHNVILSLRIVSEVRTWGAPVDGVL